MINSNKLKGRMKELQFTQADIAKELNLSQSSICLKLNNGRAFSLDEAEKLQNLLKISNSEFSDYFFYKEGCIMQL